VSHQILEPAPRRRQARWWPQQAKRGRPPPTRTGARKPRSLPRGAPATHRRDQGMWASLVSLFYVVGDFQPDDIDLREGAGVGIHRVEDLPGLKITPFVRRAIETDLLPVIAG